MGTFGAWPREYYKLVWERKITGKRIDDYLKNKLYIGECAQEARRNIGWQKISVWRLKGVRGIDWSRKYN